MKIDAAHRSSWTIAEVVFGIPFLLAITLHFAIPIPLSNGILRLALIPIAIILIVSGIRLIVSARREFTQYHQPTDPGQPTSRVVKTGVFSISRNPLYLASVLIFLGLSLMLNTFWALVALLISLILCHYILIIPEERYLTAKFGQEYEEYRSSISRWLGRKRSAKL